MAQSAIWFDFAAAGDMAMWMGVPGAGGTLAGSDAANSGNSETLLQIPAPSVWTLVLALMRPSDIHWRSWSAVMGPYYF
jgi:hypothetical protein